jgi:predicted nucleic acid-binding Zn ribbon protein
MREKKIDKEIEPQEKKSRAKFERPVKIGALIDIYNYARTHAPLKSQKELEKEAQEATKQYDDKWSTERKVMTARFLNNAVIEQAENYPKLKECISNQALFGWHNTKQNIYFQFLCFREKFNQLLENAYSYRRTGTDYPTFLDSDKTFVFGFSDDGKYQVKSSSGIADIFAEALPGVDADRIRRCAICLKIFWAKNKNSETCSEPCRNALRQRRHREKNKEEVNAKRREYYRQNKKLKEIREKKNGTL